MSRRVIPIQAVGDAGSAGECGAEPFALMVLGDSMAPEFLEGDIVVVEPDGLVDDGSFVVARCGDGWSLRKLVRIDGTWALAALDPACEASELAQHDDIKGVVVQRSHPRDRSRRKRYID